MIKTLDFTLDYKGKEYYIEAECDYYQEEYGADADGNRGVMRRCFEVEDFTVFEIVNGDKKPMLKVPDELESLIIDYCEDKGE